MALTKISTGGVKDDAASQAKIADEAIDEARLQVSNAGTNGQFLQKQSGNTGGLTWATVTVPDSDKIEEGNTSIETVDTGSNGNVRITTEGTERVRIDETGKTHIGAGTSNFGDAKVNIATGGEDGISIAPAPLGNPTSGAVLGSYAFNGALNSQTTASAEAKITAIAAENLSGTSAATDLAFYTKPTGTGPGSSPSERIRIGSSGQLGIGGATYGSSGQVLTSGGASAAPQWADAGGGAWELLNSGENTSASSEAGTIIDGLQTTYSDYKVIKVEFYIHWSSTSTGYAGFQFKAGGSWITSPGYHSQCEYGRHTNSSHMSQDTNSNSSITINEDSNDRCENITGTLAWHRGPNSEDAMLTWDAKGMAYSGANYDFLLFNGAGGEAGTKNNTLQGIRWKNSSNSNLWWKVIGMK